MKENIVDTLNMFFDFRMDNIHTVLPGKISSYDEDKRLAKVEPLVQLKTSKEVDIEYNPIENVPVMFPSGKAFSLRWDIASDDGCLILFSEAGIGNFLNSTDTSQTVCEDSSRFSLTDAVCIPGLYSSKRASDLSKNNEIYIDKDGKMTIQAKNIDILTSEDTKIESKGLLDLVASKDAKLESDKSINISASVDLILKATGNAEIDGLITKINGDSKAFVTYTELNTAMQIFVGLIMTHIHPTTSPGSPTGVPTVPITLDISASETTTVKTGG